MPGNFNPRSPCGERHKKLFRGIIMMYFNPRSPCGERPPEYSQDSPNREFQSTLPMRGATVMRRCFYERIKFQSTLPMRGATVNRNHDKIPDKMISIHAPHAGSDNSKTKRCRSVSNFNPRSPCGERPSRRVAGRMV